MGLWLPSGAPIYSGIAHTSYADLDLSPIVGKRQVMCLISITPIAGGAGGFFSVRPNGETLITYGAYAGTHGALFASLYSNKTTGVLVTTDANGIFEWYCNAAYNVQLYLEGFFPMSEAPAMVDASYTLPKTWADKDIASVLGANPAMVLMRHRAVSGSGNYNLASRPKGSTRDWRSASYTYAVGVQQYTFNNTAGRCEGICSVLDDSGVYQIESDTNGGVEELYMYGGEVDNWVQKDPPTLLYSGNPPINAWLEVDSGEGSSGLAFIEVFYGPLGVAATPTQPKYLIVRCKGDTKPWDMDRVILAGGGTSYFWPAAGPGFATGLLVVPIDENGKFEIYPASRYLQTLDWQISLLGYVLGGVVGKKSPTSHHSHWGGLATPSDLPNVSGASVQDGALEIGDRAYVVSTSKSYACTLATLGAATWDTMDADADAIHDNVAGEISAITTKIPTADDLMLIEDVADTNNKKSITCGDLPTGAATDPDAIHDNVASEISAVTQKTVMALDDLILIEDSEAANVKKRLVLKNYPRKGSPSNLWFPPGTPHSDDDEFDAATIDAAWEVYNHTGAAVGSLSSGSVDAYDTTFNSGNVVRANQNEDTRKSWILLQPPASSNIFTVAKLVTLATNELVMARLRTPQRQSVDGANEHMIGLGLYESVSSHADRDDCVELFLSKRAAAAEYAYFHRIVTGTPAGNTNTTNVDEQGQALEYVAIHKIGTTYHGWVGTAAGNWIYMGSQSFSGTIAYAGFTLQDVAVTAPGALVPGADFIRFFETDNFLF